MFLRGINYWPINKAMYWWKAFDFEEADQDFDKMTGYFNIIRIFLNWEDFQPRPDLISDKQLDNLLELADLADQKNLLLMPTFFCGHMSGVNWLPSWMLMPSTSQNRFPVFSEGHLVQASIRNFYNETDLMQAQMYQIEKVCSSLAGHPAIFAYDLGNEPSNCVQPLDRNSGRKWLKAMCDTIHKNSSSLVTLGMHAEDLEEDRCLWPQDAARYCDFLCMHGYPFYLDWISDPLDSDLITFLGLLTQYLGQKEVLIQEFGAPTLPVIAPSSLLKAQADFYASFSEAAIHQYYLRVMNRLQSHRFMGAMAWCFGDYHPELWTVPPLDENVHERHFGLFRHDGTAKPALQVFNSQGIKNRDVETFNPEALLHCLEQIGRDNYYRDPATHISNLFTAYKTCQGEQQ